ncbi:MAG: hypothetical protein CMM47_06405 [Rhodospirillaceae bacterium]|nr:hypothetical protein [Rhodospirillaceae bacterium]
MERRKKFVHAWKRRWTLLTMFCTLGLGFLGFAMVWTYWSNYQRFPPDQADRDALAWPLPEQPSVVVLPIVSVTQTDEDELLATQFGQDLIAILARVPGLFVIAPETSGRYLDGQFHIKDTAEALGVQYLVSGTMSHVREKYRIFLKVIDAFSGEVEWVEDYDVDRAGLVSVIGQDFEEVLDALGVSKDLEALSLPALASVSTEAWIAYREAVDYRIPGDRGSMEDSMARLEIASEADANWAAVPVEIAWTYLNAAKRGWPDLPSAAGKGNVRAGMAHALHAMKLDPGNPFAAARMADLLETEGKMADALEIREKAAMLGPNSFSIQWALSQSLANAGRHDEALRVMRYALRLHPRHNIGLVQELAERELKVDDFDAAYKSIDLVLARRPASVEPMLLRIYVNGLEERWQEAKINVGHFLELHQGFRFSEWSARQLARGRPGREKWSSILEKAGIPN